MDTLLESELPVVGIANAHPSIATVTVDDAAGSTLLAQHLAQKGHQHILYRSHRDRRTSVVRRQEAFLAAASDLGMSVMVTYERGILEISALEATLLAEPQVRRPTAAACWMDLNAYSLIQHSERLGVRVPEDLAVVGFDGVPMQIEPKRTLTTIRAPWADVAAQAVRHVLALLDGEALPQETILPVELVRGDTA